MNVQRWFNANAFAYASPDPSYLCVRLEGPYGSPYFEVYITREQASELRNSLDQILAAQGATKPEWEFGRCVECHEPLTSERAIRSDVCEKCTALAAAREAGT